MRFSRVNKLILETVALLLLLSAGCLNAQAEEMDSLEIRGPVYSGMNLEEILENEGGQLEMTALNFPAFYYDIDDDIATEQLVICYGNDRTIREDGLIYSTCISFAEFTYQDAAWTDEDGTVVSNYPLLALSGEPYIPLDSNSPDKLAPLLLDDDDKYTLRTGEILDLGEGYTLEAKQIDVENQKVWLEFSKDEEVIDDEIIYVSGDNPSQAVWQVDVDGVEGDDDVIVLRVHINQVFQGAVDSIAQLEGLWLIDYEDAFTINADDTFGALELSYINDSSLEFTNDNFITLTKDSYVEIAEDLKFKIADSYDLRFCVVKEISESGTHEIRGEVVENVTDYFVWDYSNFPVFYYEIDSNVATEVMEIENISGRTIPEDCLVYQSCIEQLEYECEEWDYNYDGMEWEYTGGYFIEALFGELFVPIVPYQADKLAPLLQDNDDKYTIYLGETLDLGSGYGLKLKQIDSEGENAFLEFTSEGKIVDQEVIELNANYSSTWSVDLDDIEGEYDVIVMKVNLQNIFKDGENSFIIIGGLWLIDYEKAFTIEIDDEFGVFDSVCIMGDCLEFRNEDALTLDSDSILEIAEGMNFRVADSDELRFYPFVERVIKSSSGGSGGGSGSSGGNWTSWDDPESDGGTRITTSELQEIISYWLKDLPVHPEE